MKFVAPLCLICALALLFCLNAEASDPDTSQLSETIEIIKLADKEKRAVVRSKENEKMRVVKIDDTIEPFGKIIDIVPGRIVIKNKDLELFFIQLQDTTTTIHKISKKSHSDIYRTVVQTQISSSQEEDNGSGQAVAGSKKQ